MIISFLKLYVCKLLVLERNTWNHIPVQIMSIIKEYLKPYTCV